MVGVGLGEGEAWYQSEPLTTRLKNLIRDYPEGVGIIKELIQNADDAGANRVEIIGCVAKSYRGQKTPWIRNCLCSYSKDFSNEFNPFSDGSFPYASSLAGEPRSGDWLNFFNLPFLQHVHNFVSFNRLLCRVE